MTYIVLSPNALHTYVHTHVHEKYVYVYEVLKAILKLYTVSHPCHPGRNSSTEINTVTLLLLFFFFLIKNGAIFFPAFIYTFIASAEVSHKYRFTFCLMKNYVIITCCAMLL